MPLSRSEIARLNVLRLRREKGLTQEEAAAKIPCNIGSLSQIETGLKHLGPNLEKRMLKSFSLPADYFSQIPEEVQDLKIKTHRIVLAETIPDTVKINQDDFHAVPMVAGRIAAGSGAITQEDIEDVVLIHVSKIGKGRNVVAVKIQEDKTGEKTGMSMWPILGPGDIVAINKDDRDPKKGKIYAVRIKRGDQMECTVKYVERPEEDILVLVPENKTFPVETIKLRDNPDPIIGRVIWCWRALK